jgi:hypothetical protein
MGITVQDLLESVPPETEAIVRKTCGELKTRIQQQLRDGSRLRKKQKDRSGNDNVRENVNVPVKVTSGLPEYLRDLQIAGDDPIAALIAQYRLVLARTRVGLGRVEKLAANLRKIPEGLSLVAQRDTHVPPIIALLDDLLGRCEGTDLIHFILRINKDVLGAYFYPVRDSFAENKNLPRIEIYWQAIGLFAELLDVNVADLTTVVLAHEQAHAYTHLGGDADGHSWETGSFESSELELVEGLAQYYTQQIAEKLYPHSPGVKQAYECLLQHQPPAYQTHRPWVTGSTPEAVRSAMLEERRKPAGTLQSFNESLRHATKKLYVPEDEESLFGV